MRPEKVLQFNPGDGKEFAENRQSLNGAESRSRSAPLKTITPHKRQETK